MKPFKWLIPFKGLDIFRAPFNMFMGTLEEYNAGECGGSETVEGNAR